MWNFLHSKNLPIGLDIGGSSIRMLQLRHVGGRLSVGASGSWKCPPSAGLDAARQRELTVEAICKMLRSGKFRGRSVVTSLSTAQLCIKNIRLEAQEGEALNQAVLAEARERFGFDVQSDQLNFLSAGQIRQGNDVRNEIIMMAVRPETIADHLELLESTGLRIEHVDAEPMAMFRGFERFLRRTNDEQAISVIVDIGLTGTRVVVARGRQIVFVKGIEIGGQKLTEAVAKQLNMPAEEASELRVRFIREHMDQRGQPSTGEQNGVNWTILDALRAEVESLAREINLCLRYCSVTFRGLRPESVTVIGGEAYDSGVIQLLTEHLGIPCVVGQPLKSIDTSAVDLGGDRRGVLTEWAVCTGLSLWGTEVQSCVEPVESEPVSA